MKIYPLAYTQVDWRIFNEVCQDTLGVSPSRGIDSSYMELQDPAAFLGSLDLENRPLDALRQHKLLEHYSFSFIAETNTQTLLYLQSHTPLSIFTKSVAYGGCVAILSANMRDWITTLEALLKRETPLPTRKLASCCFAYFKQTGFRELFTKYQQTDVHGTTVLE